MKTTGKVSAAWILLCSTAAVLLASCSSRLPSPSGDETAGTETLTPTAETETKGYPAPVLPDVDYSGKDFTILYRSAAHAYNITDIYTEGYTGDVINDAVYERNLAFEDHFDVHLDPRPDESPISTARLEILTDSAAFDLVGDRMFEMFPSCVEGCFYDWNDLTYINPDEPWWDSNAARELAFGGNLYMMIGDFSLSASSGAQFLFFNKKIMKDYDIDLPYSLVTEGKWTLDQMISMVKTVSEDVNGDGKYDLDDRFGFLWQVPDRLMIGCGTAFTGRDSDGYPVLNPCTDKTAAIFEKISDLFGDTKNTISYDAGNGKDISGFPHKYAFVRSYFVSDHFLFLEGQTSVAGEFTDMVSPYGVLPMPKYDDAQESYYHPVDEYSCGWAIPANNTDIRKTDILLEYFTWLSSEPLINAYYDVTLKYKRMESPDDVAMLDIIRGSVKYDLTFIANNKVRSILTAALTNGNIASEYEKNISGINAYFEGLHS